MIGITGGTGFLGRQTVSYLAEGLIPLRLLARNGSQIPFPRIDCATGDLMSADVADKFTRGCSTVIHLAGVAHSSLNTESDKNRAYAVNVDATRNLVKASLRNHVKRFIFVSTAHVYIYRGEREIDESAPTEGGSFYAQTKLLAEEIVHQASNEGMEVLIARPCLIYGAGARFNLEQMMRGIDKGYYFHISDREPKRSFLSLANAARALCHLAQSHVPPGIYNLADEFPYVLTEFVNDIAVRMARPRPRKMPYSVAALLGATGSMAQKFGVWAPYTKESMLKLTSDFTLSTRHLAESGFKWDEDTGQVRQQMVDHFVHSQKQHS